MLLSEYYDIKTYLLTLEENVNKLKTEKSSINFEMSTKIIEKIIIFIRNNYCNKKNLFEKYINTVIFGNILSFLPKEYTIKKRIICKNWYKILTCNFIKRSLSPFNKPFNIYYINSFNNNFENIVRLDNKLCVYDYNNGYVKVLNNNGEVIENHDISKYIYKVGENKNLKYSTNGEFIINDPKEKIVRDEKYFYFLDDYSTIDIFNSENKCIRYWLISPRTNDKKIIVDDGEIYVSNQWYRSIYVFSRDGKKIREITDCGSNLEFDVYGDYIYIIEKYNNSIKILTKKGEKIFKKDYKHRNCKDLLVINDNLYVVTNKKIHVYQLKFF